MSSSVAKYLVRSGVAEDSRYSFLLTGADGANLTVTQGAGQGVTFVRTGEGVYEARFAVNPGTFKGAKFTLWASTPGDLKGYTVVRDDWDATNLKLPFTVFNGSVTAADLIVAQGIDVELVFGISV